jgi:hypothetical protein
MDIFFREVRLGEKFICRRSMRYFGAVKIAPTEVSSAGTMRALKAPTYIGNAVILTDHTGGAADDAGRIISMRDSQIVEVYR